MGSRCDVRVTSHKSAGPQHADGLHSSAGPHAVQSFVRSHCIERMVPHGRRFSSGSVGLATRSSSNAARLGLLPEEPEEDADMYEELAPASDILVDGFAVPKVIPVYLE